MVRQYLADRISVTGLERHQRGVDNALVFAGKFFADQPFQFVDVEIENFRDETQDKNVFAFVLRRTAERFDCETSDRPSDLNEWFVVEVRVNFVWILESQA